MSIDTQAIIGNAVSAMLEGLEGRQLLAASLVNNHQLTVQGTNAADSIEVSLSNDGSEMWTTVNGVTSERYNAQMIWAIYVDAKSGNNRVTIDPRVTTNATIITGSGHDTIQSGAGNDNINSGSGRDMVNAGLGNDKVYTGAGNDKVNGGGGNDSLNAGSGNDSLSADGGTDKLYGKRGNDKIVSDRGDIVDAGAGHDVVTEVASFKVIDVVPSPTIRQFDLVNTETGETVAGYSSLKNGATLELAKLPKSFTIVARTGKDVQSVLYSMSDGSLQRVESNDLLALNGVQNGKAVAWNAKVGTVTLTATPYAADHGRGFIGETETLALKIVKGTATGGTTGGTTGGSTGGNTGGSNNSADPLAPKMKLAAMQTAIQAGQTYHIQAAGTVVPGYQIEDAKFSWDFGDPGSRFNTLPGFNAAHVYERAGTYTVKLTVTAPGGHVATATTTVTVTAPAINKTIYVSNVGSDSNNGTSSSSAVKSIAYALQLAGSDSQVLVKRGDAFNVNSTITISGDNVRLGTYGSGDAPRVVWNGVRTGRPVMFYIPNSASNVTVRGFTFDSIYSGDTEQTGMVITFSVGGTNTTIRDNTFLNVGYAMNLNMQPSGFLAMDNSAPSETGIRDYFCWVQGTDIVIVGNDVANSTREHIVRVGGAERILIANNSLQNLDRRTIGDSRDTAKGAITNQKGQHSYIANNELRGPAGVGPLGENDGLGEKWARFKHAAVEGNVMYDATFFLQHGAENVTFRDNTFFSTDIAAISVKAYNSAYQRGVVDLVIDHNIAVNNGTTGNFLRLEGAAESVTLTNNVYVAPYLRPGSFGTAAVSVAMSNLSAFRLIDGNIWPSNARASGYAGGGVNFVGLEYTTGNHYDPTRWNNQSNVGDDQFIDVRLDGVSLLTNSMLARV